jgi:hypothetical protein
MVTFQILKGYQWKIKKKKIKQNNEKIKKSSISNVADVQRYQWNLHW